MFGRLFGFQNRERNPFHEVYRRGPTTVEPNLGELQTAYLSLLQVTGEPWRSRYCQVPLSVLRDMIASRTGQEPEDVQDQFERSARLRSLEEKGGPESPPS